MDAHPTSSCLPPRRRWPRVRKDGRWGGVAVGRGVALAAFLLGCDAGSGGGSDSGVEVVTDGTGHDRAEGLPDLPPCPGADFTGSPGWYPANPWWYLRSTADDMYGTWQAIEAAAAATGCPSAATDGDVITYSGECSAENVEFEGTWRAESVVDRLDFVLEEVSTTVALGGLPQDLTASGWFYSDTTVVEGRIVAIEDRAEGYRSLHRGTGNDGDFVFEGVQALQDTDHFVAEGAITVDWAWGAGRYCPVVDLHAAPGCPEEPDGHYAVQGAETWLMVANGSGECDGCADVYRDGEWQEEFCGLPDMLK